MNKIIDLLPPMLSGEQLHEAMTVLPKYDPNILEASPPERLLALNNIYDLYLSNKMSTEIYTKLYLALYRSLQKKDSKAIVIQANEIFKMSRGFNGNSVIGGSDCLAIIGDSGIGKSRTLSRAVEVISGNNCLVLTEPFRKIIPCVYVQTPFDSSVKSLLLEILRSVDSALNTKYYEYAMRSKATTDNLIGTVSAVSLQHIGMIIVDEIQNCIQAKQGRNLVGCLTQLINDAGIAIVMVGTPSCEQFFGSEMYLARRTQGFHYGALQYDQQFRNLCVSLFKYQYVHNRSELTDDLLYWLYEKCQGNASVAVSLVHDAQEIAVLNGTEFLDKRALQTAYDNRLMSMHSYLQPRQKMTSSAKKKSSLLNSSSNASKLLSSFSDIVKTCQKESINPFQALSTKRLLIEIDL